MAAPKVFERDIKIKRQQLKLGQGRRTGAFFECLELLGRYADSVRAFLNPSTQRFSGVEDQETQFLIPNLDDLALIIHGLANFETEHSTEFLRGVE